MWLYFSRDFCLCGRDYDRGMATYFSKDAIKFLRGLKRNNDRVWFDERKPVYERELKAPMLALIEEINEAMVDFSPMHVRPAQKVMMRIYRDIRFSSDKRPYKTQVAAWWSRDGLEKTSGGGFLLSCEPDGGDRCGWSVYAGAGAVAGDSALPGGASCRAAAVAGREEAEGCDGEFDGLKLTRAPKGFSPDDPALDLLVCRQWAWRLRFRWMWR